MKHRTIALLCALVGLVPVLGCADEPRPLPPAPPEICELPDDAACVALNSSIYPVTAEACTKTSKKPYFCRQDPQYVDCTKVGEDENGMWCCCDPAAIGCDAKKSPPKDPNPMVCIQPPLGAVCMLLESTGYPELASACTTINTNAVPYYCTAEPKHEASCKPHPDIDDIYCCCNPLSDMFCEAHLAP